MEEPIVPQLFKGIALFTPGGDLIYCIDADKQKHWHLHLCAALQKILELPEPPHFLVPGYTATIDRWIHPHSQQFQISAELYPSVQRHQALLNAVFQTGDLLWQAIPWPQELGDPIILETYRQQFPQLWKDHDLIVHFKLNDSQATPQPEVTSGLVLRLFVSGNNAVTERTLQSLHQLLEQFFRQPYTLKVIDIFKHPEQAEAYQISATPTLVRVWPRPVRRIVGELNDAERFLQALDFRET